MTKVSKNVKGEISVISREIRPLAALYPPPRTKKSTAFAPLSTGCSLRYVIFWAEKLFSQA